MKIYSKHFRVSHYDEYSCIDFVDVVDSVTFPEIIQYIEEKFGTEYVYKLLKDIEDGRENE